MNIAKAKLEIENLKKAAHDVNTTHEKLQKNDEWLLANNKKLINQIENFQKI